MKVLVFVEQREGKLKSSAFEALTMANKISGGRPDLVAALIVGHNVDQLCTQLEGYGADKVFTASQAELESYHGLHYANALQAAIDEFRPDVVLAMASPMGRDLLPRSAARNQGGLLTDLVAIDLEGGLNGGVKPMYAGKVLAKVEYKDSAIRFATLRPNVFGTEKSKGSATPQPLSASFHDDSGLELLEIRKGDSQKQDLTEATRIVSGGRSLGSADSFKILQDCAEVISASVGASRAAVDSGYASHDMQVGQTGKTVNPSLYMAFGISGSIQHMAGMRTSKVIVAVNTDPDAPIFSIADYGIVADLFEVAPMFTKKLKELLS